MDIKDFEAGQLAYVRLTGNASRGRSGNELIEEWEIVSVGRKLIKAKRKGFSDIHAVTFEQKGGGYNGRFVEKTDSCVNYVIYANKKELDDEIESEELLNFITAYLQGFRRNISLESLRTIAALIKETQ